MMEAKFVYDSTMAIFTGYTVITIYCKIGIQHCTVPGKLLLLQWPFLDASI